ncbi:hypothetical protein CPSG_04099 [Coccidioides posadasii str. Silveira]|uniref:Uncharacterized protein n=1 Tax=Coccidioides posadasii (strain RMSCC 757 / Silveira) TaxID=443226 RepID=E9D1P1_COCPS|nr:hypothetical protein CPSG_04099 [Coccidioides posadasii str. Silveira]
MSCSGDCSHWTGAIAARSQGKSSSRRGRPGANMAPNAFNYTGINLHVGNTQIPLLEQIELDDPAYATIFISSLLEFRHDGLLKNLPWLSFRAMPTKIETPHWKGNNYGVIIHLSRLALALMIYGWSSIRRHRDPSPS